MDNAEMQLLKQQWEAINGRNAIAAGFNQHKYNCLSDNGNLKFKYYKSGMKDGEPLVQGVQFTVEFDYDRDMYNITIEIYENCDIIYRRSFDGLGWEDLNAYELYNDTNNSEFAVEKEAL